MSNVTLVEHPLIAHSLTVIRDKNTATEEFRRHADVVSKVLLIEATKHLKLKDRRITTPLAPFTGSEDRKSVV